MASTHRSRAELEKLKIPDLTKLCKEVDCLMTLDTMLRDDLTNLHATISSTMLPVTQN
jgi:hypothetical protein